MRGDAGLGKRACILTSSLLSLISATTGVGYASSGLFRECFSPLAHCCIFAALAAAFAREEFAFPLASTWLCCASLAARVLEDVAIFRDAPNLLATPPILQAAAILPGLALLWLRRRHVRAALAGVAGDWAAQEARWREVAADPTNAEGLGRIARASADMGGGAEGLRPRHRFPLRREAEAVVKEDGAGRERSAVLRLVRWLLDTDDPYLHDFTRRRLDERSPVRSLDQLYSQALGLAPVLSIACARWAAGSGGVLDLPDQRLAGSPPLAPPAPPGGMDWGFAGWESFRLVKRPARAVEKAVACYGGDVSRVTDICRGRILFGRHAC
jgi:hypothetical protein